MTREEAQEIYSKGIEPEKIDLDDLIKIIKDNWWWISIVGKRFFKLIVKWWKRRKKKKTSINQK